MNRNRLTAIAIAVVILIGGGVAYGLVHKHNNDKHTEAMMMEQAADKKKAETAAMKKKAEEAAMMKKQADTAGDAMTKTNDSTDTSADTGDAMTR